MRPEFANFIRLIYPKDGYQDHESVRKYDDIIGMNSNIYFINHNEKEENI